MNTPTRPWSTQNPDFKPVKVTTPTKAGLSAGATNPSLYGGRRNRALCGPSGNERGSAGFITLGRRCSFRWTGRRPGFTASASPDAVRRSAAESLRIMRSVLFERFALAKRSRQFVGIDAGAVRHLLR